MAQLTPASKKMATHKPFLLLLALALGVLLATGPAGPARGKTNPITAQGVYTGSQSCRECHERFYKLWEPSHHGQAMQPYTDAFASANLTPQAQPLTIQGASYQAQVGPGQGWLVEKGPDGKETRLAIKHALGGKNIFYFLTPLDRGRLQTLPLAYDLHQKRWFDTAQSGIRHAGGQAVDWRDATFTFNTSCHGCHVSQYSQNYDIASDSYRTTWREPGINCETCHGPGEEHIRVCRQAPKGTVPKDLKMVRGGRSFNHEQNNAACSSCHAKAIPLTQSFMPGDSFWDHFGLATLEHPDYYPDGRDLGENYTLTTWLLSPCARAGGLDCLHCHTSSGRFRQKKDPSAACLPCHDARVKEIAAHSHHQPGPEAPTCVSCHMPMTSFARMHRSDHSMLPPTPAATIAFDSPNACNLCHKDRDAAWADAQVRQWHAQDYQAPVLHRAGLIKAARERDWSRLPGMLGYVDSPGAEPVFAASLLQLLRSCPDGAKWPTVLQAAGHASPLVRAAAMEQLSELGTPQATTALLAGLDDPARLVRVRAAQSLSGYPLAGLDEKRRLRLEVVTREALRSLLARPDTWQAHYNLGNYYQKRGGLREAAHAYAFALKLEPRAVPPRVNLAMVQAQAGDLKGAETMLRRALEAEPDNPAAHFNLGLLLAEKGDQAGAEKHLRAALKADPQLAAAAYNLGLLVSRRDPGAAVDLLRKAHALAPSPKTALGLASVLYGSGAKDEATGLLEQAAAQWPANGELALALGEMQWDQGRPDQARAALRRALANPDLPPQGRARLQAALAGLERAGGR